jgi:hypothetical protein
MEAIMATNFIPAGIKSDSSWLIGHILCSNMFFNEAAHAKMRRVKAYLESMGE